MKQPKRRYRTHIPSSIQICNDTISRIEKISNRKSGRIFVKGKCFLETGRLVLQTTSTILCRDGQGNKTGQCYTRSYPHMKLRHRVKHQGLCFRRIGTVQLTQTYVLIACHKALTQEFHLGNQPNVKLTDRYAVRQRHFLHESVLLFHEALNNLTGKSSNVGAARQKSVTNPHPNQQLFDMLFQREHNVTQ